MVASLAFTLAGDATIRPRLLDSPEVAQALGGSGQKWIVMSKRTRGDRSTKPGKNELEQMCWRALIGKPYWQEGERSTSDPFGHAQWQTLDEWSRYLHDMRGVAARYYLNAATELAADDRCSDAEFRFIRECGAPAAIRFLAQTGRGCVTEELYARALTLALLPSRIPRSWPCEPLSDLTGGNATYVWGEIWRTDAEAIADIAAGRRTGFLVVDEDPDELGLREEYVALHVAIYGGLLHALENQMIPLPEESQKPYWFWGALHLMRDAKLLTAETWTEGYCYPREFAKILWPRGVPEGMLPALAVKWAGAAYVMGRRLLTDPRVEELSAPVSEWVRGARKTLGDLFCQGATSAIEILEQEKDSVLRWIVATHVDFGEEEILDDPANPFTVRKVKRVLSAAGMSGRPPCPAQTRSSRTCERIGVPCSSSILDGLPRISRTRSSEARTLVFCPG